ncbi:MAG: Lrp/AsnC family transcriptional regulator [Thermoplasmatota archaeon]
MDDIDRRLLTLLRENGRASFTSLANEVGTSEGTIRARMKRLVTEGVITQFTIRTAGSQVKALIEVVVERNTQTSDVSAAIRSWDGVESVWEVTGEQDLVIVADCPDTARLNQLIDDIRGIPGTDATRSRLILREA